MADLKKPEKTKDSVLYEELLPAEFLKRLSECPVAYLPLGTLEWHGPHLPLGTDIIQGKELFKIAAEEFGGIVLPGLFLGPDRIREDGDLTLYGMDLCPRQVCRIPYEDQKFPGSAYWISDEDYDLLLEIIIKQLKRAGFKAVVGVGHGPSAEAFNKLKEKFREKYDITLYAPDFTDPTPMNVWIFDHASKSETSNMLYLRPDLVDLSRLPDDPSEGSKGLGGEYPKYTASASFAEKITEIVLSRIGEFVSSFK